MDPRYATALVVLASAVMIAIRAPHGQRSRTVAVVSSRKGRAEVFALIFAWIGFFVPFVWMCSSAFNFADYPLHMAAFGGGVACFAVGLWLFHRSHKDLGTNWSITLEVRERHQLITDGVYRRVRHPMYSALFLYSIGQALALPNWIAGPSGLVAFGALYLLRVRAEEQMMRDTFGAAYDDYAARTTRLVPGLF